MLFLAKSDTFLIKEIANIFGFIMECLFKFTAMLGIQNVGLCIILFTLVTKLLMMPLTIKQQKFARMSTLMNPELQALMNKYKGKTDQDSMIKMRQEQKEIYEKYGTSQSAGCLQLLIQFPIIFALYDIIRNIPFYVKSIGIYFENIILDKSSNGLMANLDKVAEYVEKTEKASSSMASLANAKNSNAIMDILNNFGTKQWNELESIFAESNVELANTIAENSDKILEMNEFFGISLADKPEIMSIAVLIPIISGFSQWLSLKISQTRQEKKQSGKVKEPENNMMQSMNTMMPIMSAIFCLTFPAGIGIYWISQSVFQIFIQLGVNWYFDRQDINDIIAKNIEKANKKREKQGLPPKKNISANTNINVSKVQSSTNTVNTEKKNENIKKSTEYYRDSSKGSIAERAAMVSKYNEKNNKK